MTTTIIDRNGAWNRYVSSFPLGFAPVGTVEFNGFVGALMFEAATDEFLLINDNSEYKTIKLNQNEIKAQFYCARWCRIARE